MGIKMFLQLNFVVIYLFISGSGQKLNSVIKLHVKNLDKCESSDLLLQQMRTTNLLKVESEYVSTSYNNKIWLVGCFEDLYRFSDLSAILWLGNWRKPLSEIVAARPDIEPGPLDQQAKSLNHYTTAAPTQQ